MRHFGSSLIGAIVVVSVVASTGVVASAKSPDSGGDRQDEILTLLNRAETQIRRHHPACRFGSPFPKPTYSDGSPSEELLNTLGVLRREQTDEEARIARSGPRLIPARGIYRRYVRIAHSANGDQFLIVAARNTNVFPRRPERCLVVRRKRFNALLEGRPAKFRRAARRVLARQSKWERKANARGPEEGVYTYLQAPDFTAGGGGVGARQIRRTGMFGSSSTGGRRSTVSGLLPDGVASITVVFPRRISRGPGRPPKRYKRTIRRTSAVQENVVSFTVPRRAEDALTSRMIWRDEQGEVVHTVDNSH